MIDIEKDAKELLESAKKRNETISKKPEARGAGPESSTETPKTKAEEPEETKVTELEKQAEQDKEILSKKESDLTEPEKQRKAEIDKGKKESEEKEKKSNVQKRIDELTGKIKDLERDKDATRAEKDELRAELDAVKKQLSLTPQDKVKEKLKGEMSSRVNKYLEEDKSLPREDRREMTDDELDEWASEDYKAANEWMTKRTLRRIEEERDIKQSLKAEEILDKQEESAKRTYAKHPELDISERQVELVKEGKKPKEIVEILCKENPKYKLAMEIYKENPYKYMLADNAPELIVAEIEKRTSKESEKKDDEEVESLKAEIERLKAEKEKLENLDSSISSTRQPPPKEELTELEKSQIKLAGEVGLGKDKLKNRLKWRKENVR